MVVRKTNTRKTAKRTVFKITAAYSGKFQKLADAQKAQKQLKANPKAQIAPIKKAASGYLLGVKYVFMTADAKIRDQAVKGARAQGAKITLSTVKV